MTTSTALTTKSVSLALQNHVGRVNAIKAPDLVAKIVGQGSDASATRQLRKLIKELRRQGYPICAHSTWGYWWANTPEELEVAIQFLKGKAMSSLGLIGKLRRLAMPELAGQLPLLPEAEATISAEVVEFPADLLALVDDYASDQALSRDEVVRRALATYLSSTAKRGARKAHPHS